MPLAICPQAKLTPTANESPLAFITLNTNSITEPRSLIPRAAHERLDLHHFREQTLSRASFAELLVLKAVIAYCSSLRQYWHPLQI